MRLLPGSKRSRRIAGAGAALCASVGFTMFFGLVEANAEDPAKPKRVMVKANSSAVSFDVLLQGGGGTCIDTNGSTDFRDTGVDAPVMTLVTVVTYPVTCNEVRPDTPKLKTASQNVLVDGFDNFWFDAS
jgi:hypothetical protein